MYFEEDFFFAKKKSPNFQKAALKRTDTVPCGPLFGAMPHKGCAPMPALFKIGKLQNLFISRLGRFFGVVFHIFAAFRDI